MGGPPVTTASSKRSGPRPRHTYENGCIAVPVDLRRAVVGRYGTITAICKDFLVSKYTAAAIAEPYGVLEEDLLKQFIARAEELGIYSVTEAA
jgi:hypothetical protein